MIASDIHDTEGHFSKFLKANSSTHIKLSSLLATQYVTEVMHLALFSVLSPLTNVCDGFHRITINHP